MTTASTVLTGDDFPALYQSASKQSVDAQNSFLFWSKVRLISIVVAAAGGVITLKTPHIQIGGAVAFLAFAAALAAELILLIRRTRAHLV